jgi:penicillin-binding protein 1C
VNKRIKKLLIIAAGSAGLFFLADLAFPVNAEIEFAPIVEARDGTVLHTYLTKDHQWRMKARLDEITPELSKAIVYKEDKYFYWHPGINVFAVGRAMVNNFFYWKRTSGASTITMQVARMLQPKERTYVNKITEMFRALQLELHYSKDEILQLYLNLVPYGSNIQGVKAASILYFDKMPGQLSLAEITALSIIPNRPNSLVIGKDNPEIVRQRNKWLIAFRKDKLFPAEQVHDALQEPLAGYRHGAKDKIPQLSSRLRNMYRGSEEIRSTIDDGIQQKVEDLVSNYMAGLRLNNIHNAAVIITDNRTHEVLAYLGSNDFRDKSHQGEVDGIMALRSPGSTLKPLLYGLCFDKGLITAKSMIADVPVNIGGYIPENYDLQFRGNITAEDALKQSLNIPAVKLVNQVGVKTFVNSLTEAGFVSIWRKRRNVGLSLILGGCEVRLDELTGMYAALANDGNYQPLVYTLHDSLSKKNNQLKNGKGYQVLSPVSAYMVSQVLTGLHRPDLPNLYEKSTGLPRIAWKTGTSYGRKDAWTIGYNKRFTIGVWIGNFDGKGVAGLNGAGTATPLLFQLFKSIDKKCAEEWLRAPQDIGFRLICRETGKIPNDYCESQVMDYYIPGISSNERCQHLNSVFLSADEKFCFCTTCLPLNGYKLKTYPNISAELSAYYESHHMPYEKLPPHNPSCTRMFEGKAPVITSLTDRLTYLITDKDEQKLQLDCNVSNDVGKIFWYINDQFYSSASPGEKLFFKPNGKELKISCTDDKGRNTDIKILVKYI